MCSLYSGICRQTCWFYFKLHVFLDIWHLYAEEFQARHNIICIDVLHILHYHVSSLNTNLKLYLFIVTVNNYSSESTVFINTYLT